MPYTTLISTAELEPHLADPGWAVVDCRFQLKDIEAGRKAYLQAHIPGAIYAHLNDDLSGPIIPGQTGRHPLPPVDAAARTFSAFGIDASTQVVVYDDVGGALAASRLWWMLRWLGHDNVAVLDGGLQKWQSEGRPTRGGTESRPPRDFVPDERSAMLTDADGIIKAIKDPAFLLFDARTNDRYRGENEVIDPVAGHIPGAVSTPYPDNLNPDGTFKSVEELRAMYQPLLADHVVSYSAVYCGSGGTAPLNILAMLHAGLGESMLYAGSWSEWITSPDRPIKTGDET
jgi:thiosulfate/3-mercaptopyruvate sulfurtransferase